MIRAGRESDLEALYRLDVACFAPVFRFSRRTMREFCRAPGALTLVAEGGAAEGGAEGQSGWGTIAGFLILELSDASGVPGEREGYVVTLDVAPERRRRGIAGRLLEAAEAAASRAGAGAIWLHVWTENLAAIAFYERSGFRRTVVQRGFYGRERHAFEFRKELGRAVRE